MKPYRLVLILLLLLLTLSPISAWSGGPAVSASKVWIRQSPPGVTVLAGYFTLQDLTDKPLDLKSVSSPNFASVEMHRSFVKDGQEQMAPVLSITLPAHGSVEFKPGSYHLMLMQPKKNLFAGDMVTLTLEFSDGSELTLMAPVRRDPPQR
ncbi:MAG TPA: copper chaperone PCu(A)C [Gammaproteobacteria bacterium]